MKYLLFIYLVLMGIFAFSDLNISLMLVNEGSVFAEVFDRIGFFPMMILAAFAFIILAFKSYKYLFLFLSILMHLVMVLAYGYFANGINIFIVLFAMILFYFEYKFASRIYIDYQEKAIIMAKSLIYFMLMAFLITTIAKVIWGRPRFRSMSDPINEFMPWYILNPFGLSDDFKSFPSGHTTQAAMIIGLLFFNDLTLIKKRRPLFIFICLWTLIVALSRVIAGAHFASDVLTGMMVTYSCYYFVRSYYFNKHIKAL